MQDDPSTLVLTIYMGGLHRVPGVWLWPGVALAIGAICEVNQQLDLCLSAPFFLLLCLSYK